MKSNQHFNFSIVILAANKYQQDSFQFQQIHLIRELSFAHGLNVLNALRKGSKMNDILEHRMNLLIQAQSDYIENLEKIIEIDSELKKNLKIQIDTLRKIVKTLDPKFFIGLEDD